MQIYIVFQSFSDGISTHVPNFFGKNSAVFQVQDRINNRKFKKKALFKVGAKGLGRHTRLWPAVRFRYTSREIPNPAPSTPLTIHVVSVSCQETCQHRQAKTMTVRPKEGEAGFHLSEQEEPRKQHCLEVQPPRAPNTHRARRGGVGPWRWATTDSDFDNDKFHDWERRRVAELRTQPIRGLHHPTPADSTSCEALGK